MLQYLWYGRTNPLNILLNLPKSSVVVAAIFSFYIHCDQNLFFATFNSDCGAFKLTKLQCFANFPSLLLLEKTTLNKAQSWWWFVFSLDQNQQLTILPDSPVALNITRFIQRGQQKSNTCPVEALGEGWHGRQNSCSWCGVQISGSQKKKAAMWKQKRSIKEVVITWANVHNL